MRRRFLSSNRTLDKIKQYIQYIFGDYVPRAFTGLLALIGFMQLISPLLPNDLSENNWWTPFFTFFVNRWDWYIWVIVVLGALTIVLGRGLWRLGGFDLELSLRFHSQILTHGRERYFGLNIENISPGEISQLSVRLENLQAIGKSNWTPPPLLRRKDKFLWTSWEPPRIGSKSLVPGFEISADLMRMEARGELAIFTLQAQTEYLLIPPGKYRANLLIRGVFSGKKFEVPLAFIFRYGEER